MNEPRTEAGKCPCGGRCHHDIAPCSLGCWAVHRPWAAEEAIAADRAALAEAVRALPGVKYGNRTSTRTAYRRDVLALIEGKS